MNEIEKIIDVFMEVEFKDLTPIEILLKIFKENKEAKDKS